MKFFRKIRERMLKENKVSKYLLYAVGEIVLVLIGILLALQINTYRKNKNDKKTVGLHVIAVLDETQDNVSKLKDVLRGIERFDNNTDTLRALYNAKDFSNPKMLNTSVVLYTNMIFVPSTTSFENLKNSAEYALIDNFAVKKSLGEAYNTFNRIKTAEEKDKIPKTAFYTDYVLPNGFLLNPTNKSESFFSDPYFGNMIWSVDQTNSNITLEVNKALTAMQELEGILKKYYDTLDLGPIKERIDVLELIENGMTPDEVISMIRKQDPNDPDIIISENIINAYGYVLFRGNRYEDALKIFKLNIELYPASANTYDSYGETLLIMGDTLNAMQYYKKALELDNNLGSAIKMVKAIKKK